MNKTVLMQGCEKALLPIVHLHTHTEYSQLDGIAKIEELIEKAIEDGMPGMAISDHANMFGVKEFVNCVNRKNREKNTNFKPIIGCEVYVARRGMEQKEGREDFAGYHLILLAKNYTGYKSLIKLVSRSWTEGFCGRARTDKADLERYHEGLICCSACIGGEVAQHILNDRLDEAEESAKWYKNIFGEDCYLELQRHKATAEKANHTLIELEERVNEELMVLSRKLGIKLICTNDIHFVNEEDAEAQDTFMCLTWEKRVDDPDRLVFSKQEWLKTTAEMNELFADVPEALNNTVEILNKVELYPIDHAPILPQPTMPEGVDEVEHLARLTFKGAHKRFGEPLAEEIKVRLKDELKLINKRDYPTYFLMWHEIFTAARKLGVQIGPGRGRVASSLVAYCLGLTEINPLEWELSYERFLNPENSALPDIDVDVDEYGREQLIAWMMERYGEKSVTKIVTTGRYGSLLCKKLVAEAFDQTLETMDEQTTAIASKLENVVRFTHPHVCGVAICKDDVSDWVPMAYIYDSSLGERVVATQYEGSLLDDTGVIKLDILSHKHLDAVRRTLELLRQKRGVDIELENIPKDDIETFELLGRGETMGVFQFESETMQNLLREQRPTTLRELADCYSTICKVRPHAICYTRLAYHTAYLKAHYPTEYLSVLSYVYRHNPSHQSLYNAELKKLNSL